MVDYNVTATERWINDQEDANEAACAEAADANGLTMEQAENCDDCEHRCPLCPWRHW